MAGKPFLAGDRFRPRGVPFVVGVATFVARRPGGQGAIDIRFTYRLRRGVKLSGTFPYTRDGDDSSIQIQPYYEGLERER